MFFKQDCSGRYADHREDVGPCGRAPQARNQPGLSPGTQLPCPRFLPISRGQFPGMRIDLNPIGWRRMLLIVLTLWALAMIAPGLYRLFNPLGTIGLSADNDGVVTDVVAPFASPQESPAAVAGIVPGDQIALRAMRCVPLGTPQCASLVAVLGGLGGMQSVWPHRRITLIIHPASPQHRRPSPNCNSGGGPGSAQLDGKSGAPGRHPRRHRRHPHCIPAGLDASELDDLGFVSLCDLVQSRAVVCLLRAIAALADGNFRPGDRRGAGARSGIGWPGGVCLALPQ